jgi:hypothetical protein
VGTGFHAGNRLEAESNVELGGRAAVGPQAQKVEMLSGELFEPAYEPPADTRPARLSQDIEVTYATDIREACIGIAIESADANHTFTCNGDKQCLAGPIEAVFARLPIVDQAAHELEAGGVAFLEKLGQATGRQFIEPVNRALFHRVTRKASTGGICEDASGVIATISQDLPRRANVKTI